MQLSGIRGKMVTPPHRGLELAGSSLTGTVHTGLLSWPLWIVFSKRNLYWILKWRIPWRELAHRDISECVDGVQGGRQNHKQQSKICALVYSFSEGFSRLHRVTMK